MNRGTVGLMPGAHFVVIGRMFDPNSFPCGKPSLTG